MTKLMVYFVKEVDLLGISLIFFMLWKSHTRINSIKSCL